MPDKGADPSGDIGDLGSRCGDGHCSDCRQCWRQAIQSEPKGDGVE